MQEFEKLITKEFTKKNHDSLLDDLKLTIQHEASQTHKWDTKAMDSLVNNTFLYRIFKILNSF
jgi:hypothetical protein